MSLQEPTKKMSKSDDNPNASVFFWMIRIQLSGSSNGLSPIQATRYDMPEKPGISNLIEIYSVATGKSIPEIEKEFDGKGYGEFKIAVGEAVAAMLKPVQDRYNELCNDKEYIDNVIKTNAEKASYYANKTLRKVQKKVGFPEKIR